MSPMVARFNNTTVSQFPEDYPPDAESRAALEELARRKMKSRFPMFFRGNLPNPQYTFGVHTVAILRELDLTTKMVEAGECRYLCICVPPRHGKSDIVSRRYPVWHLLRNPDHEVILTSYNYSLASDMSYELRRLMREIGSSFGYEVQRDRSALESWHLQGYKGAVHSAGLGGTITGRGANILVIDDYFKNREEAESTVIRQRKWESFESDLLTRLAPVHAVVIVANRWHEDDPVGRIQRKNDPGSDLYDEEFPEFEVITFPAYDETTKTWLFRERFGAEWYRKMRAFMGTYAWQAQGQQNPRPRTGNLLRADLVKVVDANEVPRDLNWRRGWDLASTKKQRAKDDPDYTVGTKAAYDKHTGRLYVANVQRGQWNALRRDTRIRNAAIQDGPGVRVIVEAVAGYMDTYHHMKRILRGKAVVRRVTPSKDLVARASASLEAVFEAGNVFVVKGPWNKTWVEEFLAFPSGKHDDQVASLLVAVYNDIMNRGAMGFGRLDGTSGGGVEHAVLVEEEEEDSDRVASNPDDDSGFGSQGDD